LTNNSLTSSKLAAQASFLDGFTTRGGSAIFSSL
jgi:hypothetical protein